MQVALNTRITYELAVKLDSHSKETGLSKAQIVAKALEQYLKNA